MGKWLLSFQSLFSPFPRYLIDLGLFNKLIQKNAIKVSLGLHCWQQRHGSVPKCLLQISSSCYFTEVKNLPWSILSAMSGNKNYLQLNHHLPDQGRRRWLLSTKMQTKIQIKIFKLSASSFRCLRVLTSKMLTCIYFPVRREKCLQGPIILFYKPDEWSPTGERSTKGEELASKYVHCLSSQVHKTRQANLMVLISLVRNLLSVEDDCAKSHMS